MLNKTKLLPFQCKTIMQSTRSPGWVRSKWKLRHLLTEGHSKATEAAGGGNFPGKGCRRGEGNACQQMRGIMRRSQGLRVMGKGKVFTSQAFHFWYPTRLPSPFAPLSTMKPLFPTQTWTVTAREHQQSSSQYHPTSMGWNVWLQLQVSSVLARLRVRAACLQRGRLLLQALASHPFGPLLGDQLQGISSLLGLKEEGEGAADVFKN